MIDKEETKVFLKTLNSISSCENTKQLMFMSRWIYLAQKRNRLTNDKFLRIVKTILNIRKKQLWRKEKEN